MAVAPPSPGREWFLDHPWQHTVFPIMRAPDVSATFYNYAVDEAGGMAPLMETTLDRVEVWWDPRSSVIKATCKDSRGDWIIRPEDSEADWADGFKTVFEFVVDNSSQPQQPPRPVGTGWEDFDWSK